MNYIILYGMIRQSYPIPDEETEQKLRLMSEAPIESITIENGFLTINRMKFFKTELPDQKLKSYKLY